jgi:hypothetical protein
MAVFGVVIESVLIVAFYALATPSSSSMLTMLMTPRE